MDNKRITVLLTCHECGNTYKLHMTTEEYARYMDWRLGKGLIQDLDFLNEDERELCVSGICGKCFDEEIVED
jgi:hypothetical protein